MNDPYPPPVPPYQQPQPPRSGGGMGCFAKGCLITIVVLMIVGVAVGGFGWYVFKGTRDYFSQQPVPIRVYPATDEQYQAVLAKLQPFGVALNQGHATTLQLSADELNTLIAKLPDPDDSTATAPAALAASPVMAAAVSDLAKLRGKVYLSFVNNQIVSEISTPLGDRSSGANKVYFNGRVKMDASYSADEFTFVLRSVTPLKGEPSGFISRFSNNAEFLRSFSKGMSEGFNRSFNEELNKNSQGVASRERIRTIVLQDNQIVFTSAESVPEPSATAPAEVAPSAKTE